MPLSMPASCMVFSSSMPSFMGFWNAFSAADQTNTTGTFINHRGHGCFSQVGCATFPAAVDQPDPAHIAVGNLVPGRSIGWSVVSLS